MTLTSVLFRKSEFHLGRSQHLRMIRGSGVIKRMLISCFQAASESGICARPLLKVIAAEPEDAEADALYAEDAPGAQASASGR